MYASWIISEVARVLVASLFVACIFSWPLSAYAASKKGGVTNNAQTNSAKRDTANNPLSDAAKAGATQGVTGGSGGPHILKNPRDTSQSINSNIK